MIPPVYQNGVIIMYEVFYVPHETFNKSLKSESLTVSGLEMSVVLHELEEFVSYNISVRAYTSAGAGPCSDEVTVTTLEDSKFPPALYTDS